MSSTQRVRFDKATWQRGTRGQESASTSNKPYIQNLRLAPNGELGVRPKWETSVMEIDSKFDLQTVVTPAEYRYLGTYIKGWLAVDGEDVEFFIVDDEDPVYTGLYGNTYAASTTNTDVPNRNASVYRISDTRWLINDALIDLRTESVAVGTRPITVTSVDSALQTAFGIFAWTTEGSTIHQGRAFYWGYGTDAIAVPFPTNRIYYSDSIITNGYDGYVEFGQYAGAAPSAGAEQYFDVDGEVEGCVSVGPNLMIWTREGRWFIMQGSGDPGTATFNQLSLGPVPADERFVTRIDSSAVFLSSDGMRVVSVNGGGQLDDASLAHLGFDEVPVVYGDSSPPNISTSSLHNATLMPYTVDTARHNLQGMWSDEDWDITTYANFQVRHDERQALEMLAIYTPGMTTNWQIHQRGLFSDAGGTAEETTVLGHLILPRLFDPTKQIRIKRVVIDGVAGASADMDVTVDDGDGNSTTMTLGPGATPLATGAFRAVATGAPNAYTHFADVSIENITGLTIESITVEFEISEGAIL